jgi:hypothetical protein
MGIAKAAAAAIAAAFLIASPAGASAIKLKKTELPDAVREAVEHAAPGGHVSACWRLTGYDEPMYEVDVKVDGRKKGVVISSEGKVLTVQEEITWEDLPGRVQDRLQQVAGDHDIEEVHEIWQRGEIVGYGARIDGENGDFTYEVGPHGESFRDGLASRSGERRRERTPPPEQTQQTEHSDQADQPAQPSQPDQPNP